VAAVFLLFWLLIPCLFRLIFPPYLTSPFFFVAFSQYSTGSLNYCLSSWSHCSIFAEMYCVLLSKIFLSFSCCSILSLPCWSSFRASHSSRKPCHIVVMNEVAHNFRNTYTVLLVCPSTVSRTRATAPLRRSLTMATKKPPVDPPDTDSYGEDSSYGTHSEAIGHDSAESSESFDSNSEENEYVERPLAPEPKVHPAQVTVIKDGNGLCFLANLLIRRYHRFRARRLRAGFSCGLYRRESVPAT
jgi:hypothetical protein